MGDWPTQIAAPSLQTISVLDVESIGNELRSLYGGTAQQMDTVFGAVWSSANRAYYIPFTVAAPIVVDRMAVWPIIQSGNLDVGIYDSQKNRLVSSGSTAVGTAAAMQNVNVTDTTLQPGVYYMALAINNTTAKVAGLCGTFSTPAGIAALDAEACGVYQQNTAFALPSTATWVAAANTPIPWIGLTARAVV